MNARAVWQQLITTSPSHIRRHPVGYVLSLMSIAMAVALIVSMRTTQASVLAAFRSNMEAMAGHADYRITSSKRLDSRDLAAIEQLPGVRAAPIVQASGVLMPQQRAMMVLGIDVLRDTKLRDHQLDQQVVVDLPTLLTANRAVIIPAAFAERYDLKVGSAIKLAGPGGLVEFTVAGILKNEGVGAINGGNIVVTDIATAQRYSGRDGFDRIEVALDGGTTTDSLRAALGPAAIVSSTRGSDPTFDYVYSQMQTILGCVSLLACVIGLFIVYNAMSLSVVQRARHIGTLRALGARRVEVLLVFALEATLLGLVASILGAMGGRVIADHALQQAAATLTIMIDFGSPKLVVPWDAWVLAPLMGVLAAVSGALMPARAAAMLPPVLAMKPRDVEQHLQLRTRLWLAVGVILLIACLVLVRHPRTNWGPTVIGVMMGVFGMALVGPQLLVWCRPVLLLVARQFSSVPVNLAVDNILKFPSRTSLTVVALAGSLSIVVAVKATIGGLQDEVNRWMTDVFVFDLTAQMNDLSASPYPLGTFSGTLRDEAAADSRCTYAYGVRTLQLPFKGDEVMLIAYDGTAFHEVRIARGLSDPQVDRARAQALRDGKVHVSRNLASIRGIKAGDRISLPTPSGAREFEVDGIQTDYSWFRGSIFMDLEVYRQIWKDQSLSYLDLRVRDGTDIEAFRADLVGRWAARDGVFVHRADKLREHGLRFLSDWFNLANLQLLLGVVVGGVGVANTLLISLLSQSRQIGLLRAIGATAGQIQRMLAVEAGLIGLLGGVLGCIGGLMTVVLLVSPMAVKATGFGLPIIIPWGSMVLAIVAALAIALGAALLPLRAVRRIDVIRAIGYE